MTQDMRLPMERRQIESGDFQTPLGLAREVCSAVARTGYAPASVIEPTCGSGSFLAAALELFPSIRELIGIDRDEKYVQQACSAVQGSDHPSRVRVFQGDFFTTDWPDLIARLPHPILILGNPPWVTNSVVGAIGGSNLPEKSNRDRMRGIDALTGKSNFDISEWMIRMNLECLASSSGLLAMLCKTAVARRVLLHAWSRELPIEAAEIRRIDSGLHFGVSVDACLLLARLGSAAATKTCGDYSSLGVAEPQTTIGFRDDTLVANIQSYDRWRGLLGNGHTAWRSGIKHDCKDVFELRAQGIGFENGLGEQVDIEPEVVYPLLKGTDLFRGRTPRKWLLVPQESISGSPEDLQRLAPKAWSYLLAHRSLLDRRRSSIYRHRPPYSIFGVGPYSFSPWKIAISGLHKQLDFVIVPPFQDRPVVLDDTCYFLPCQSEQECRTAFELVTSAPAREFWSSLIFRDAKRPITSRILNRLDLAAVARAQS